ncbi:MAG: hypothetical protein ACLPWF_14990 [Bryobacteraceae bacterium]
MKLLSRVALTIVAALLAVPLLAQTQIGGGACDSSSLNGTYAVSVTGRQVNSSGTFLSVLQANGTATFDGLSGVTITSTADTNQATSTALNWSGTYSVPVNCAAVVNITTGGTITLNLMLYNQGRDFLLTGNDATYSYTGSGVFPFPQPATCSTSTLNGPFTFNTTGFQITSNAVSDAADTNGTLQFDGQGNVTANTSTATSTPPISQDSLTGTYTVSSDCTGMAMLTDSNSNAYAMNFSIYSTSSANTNFYLTLASTGNALSSGAGHTAYTQATGTCSTSSLNGGYSLNVGGRGISSSGVLTGSLQSVGTVTFDGNGNATLAGTFNTNGSQNNTYSYAGTYTLSSDCSGTLTGNSVTWSLVVWNGGANFAMVAFDGKVVNTASGNNTSPPACDTPTLSGEYTFTASGFPLSGTTLIGAQDEAGIMQFDGQGNVTASYTDTQGGTTPVSYTATGTYMVASDCTASASWTDSSGNANTLNFVIEGAYGQNAEVLAFDSQYNRLGSAHSAFLNPSQSIGNVASYAINSTPPGSVFVLFGQNLAPSAGGAVSTTLPTTIFNTSVTVNGESAPLFYVNTGQIDAQVPWDIPGNTVASVIVTNGSSTSSAAALYVSGTGTPGISVYGNNRAVVVNADGNVNSATDQASVGDEVVVYFTGGGPVQAAGTLTTGAPAPSGLSPVTGQNSATVGGVAANVVYMGLTPFGIGLYQANINVPQLDPGTYPVVITIAGYSSNDPVMSVSN